MTISIVELRSKAAALRTAAVESREKAAAACEDAKSALAAADLADKDVADAERLERKAKADGLLREAQKADEDARRVRERADRCRRAAMEASIEFTGDAKICPNCKMSQSIFVKPGALVNCPACDTNFLA